MKVQNYDKEMDKIIFRMWVPPAGIWVDDETSAVIAVSVDPRGKITAKKIIKRSPNAAVNVSVEKLIRDLDEAPIPPRGEATGWVQITLKQTN